MLDLKKPIVTRTGKPVRILCTDLKGYRNVIEKDLDGYSPIRQYFRTDLLLGLILHDDGAEETKRWTPEGLDLAYTRPDNEEKPTDLINKKVKKWRWVYKDKCYGYCVLSHYSEKELETYFPELEITGRILETEIEE